MDGYCTVLNKLVPISAPTKGFVRSLSRLDHLDVESNSINAGLIVTLTRKLNSVKESKSKLEKRLAHLEPEHSAFKDQLSTHYKVTRVSIRKLD